MPPPAPPMRDRQPVCASTLILRTHAPRSPSKSSLSRHARASPHLEDELTLKWRDLITSFTVMFLFSVEFSFQTMFFFGH